MKKIAYTLLFSICVTSLLYAQTPAFPTAEGFGKFAKGGRGGKVVFVENLDDYISYNSLETPIPGSFRWALAQNPGEPLTVIFRVSGVIKLKPYLTLSGTTVTNQNDIRCSRANLTIAGQTAPGEGIIIRNGKVNLGGCTDLVVRNIRFRIGDTADPTPIYGYKVGGVAKDTLAPAGSFLPGGSVGCENALRVIFDHCVFGWSGEENLTMYDNKFTTLQWSMLHEALYDDGHGKGSRSYGGQLGGTSATYVHNLLAHNQSRSPRLNGARTTNEIKVFIEFINNVVYNWGSSGAPYGADIVSGTTRSHTANFTGNYYKPGPATASTKYFFTNYIVNGANLPKWYLANNYMEGSSTMNSDNWTGFTTKWSGTAGSTLPTKTNLASDTLLYPPQDIILNGSWVGYIPYKLAIETPQSAYQSVINKVGTIHRDSVERRIIKELTTGTASFKASLGTWGIIDKTNNVEGYLPYTSAVAPTDNDRDGMADDWESVNGLNPNDPLDRNRVTKSGYTVLEVYLNSLMGETIPLEFDAASVELSKSSSTIVFPSMVKSTLNIKSEKEIEEIKVLNATGLTVLSCKDNVTVVNLSSLNKGFYFLNLTYKDNTRQTFKVEKI